MKCKNCGQEMPKSPTKTLKIDKLGIEVETQAHHQGEQVKKILADIPKGWRLLTEPEWNALYNDKKLRKQLKMLPEVYDVEYYEQPIEDNKKEYPVRRLCRCRDCLSAGNDDLLSSNSDGRVRFCRDLKKPVRRKKK